MSKKLISFLDGIDGETVSIEELKSFLETNKVVDKELLDKKLSELSESKNKIKELSESLSEIENKNLSEDEKVKLEIERLTLENDKLKRDSIKSEVIAYVSSSGISVDNIKPILNNLINDDRDISLENAKVFVDTLKSKERELEERIKGEIVGNVSDPKVTGKTVPASNTLPTTYEERVALKQNDPELYYSLTGKGE